MRRKELDDKKENINKDFSIKCPECNSQLFVFTGTEFIKDYRHLSVEINYKPECIFSCKECGYVILQRHLAQDEMYKMLESSEDSKKLKTLKDIEEEFEKSWIESKSRITSYNRDDMQAWREVFSDDIRKAVVKWYKNYLKKDQVHTGIVRNFIREFFNLSEEDLEELK